MIKGGLGFSIQHQARIGENFNIAVFLNNYILFKLVLFSFRAFFLPSKCWFYSGLVLVLYILYIGIPVVEILK